MRKLLIPLTLLVACGEALPEDEPELDAGHVHGQDGGHDAGTHALPDGGADAGAPDAGALEDAGAPLDAGRDAGAQEPDAGAPADAGHDAGQPFSDAGSPQADAGPVDAGHDCPRGQPGCVCDTGNTCIAGPIIDTPFVCDPGTNMCVNCGYVGGPCCDDGSGTIAGHTCNNTNVAQCLHHAGRVWNCHSNESYACNPAYPETFYYAKACWEGGCCDGLTCTGVCAP